MSRRSKWVPQEGDYVEAKMPGWSTYYGGEVKKVNRVAGSPAKDAADSKKRRKSRKPKKDGE